MFVSVIPEIFNAAVLQLIMTNSMKDKFMKDIKLLHYYFLLFILTYIKLRIDNFKFKVLY